MRYAKIGAAVILGLVLVALGWIIVSDRMAQPAEPDLAAFVAKAKTYDVHIARDTYGVPHIFGHRDADVAFGLGFAHSEDDYATIQNVVLATRGTLAASEGIDAAKTDYIVPLLHVWKTVNAGYASLPADLRKVCE